MEGPLSSEGVGAPEVAARACHGVCGPDRGGVNAGKADGRLVGDEEEVSTGRNEEGFGRARLNDGRVGSSALTGFDGPAFVVPRILSVSILSS